MGWQSKSVVVTGAAGFIGSHLVEALANAGAEVTAVVRYTSRGDDGNLALIDPRIRESIRVERIDLRDLDAARTVLDGADVVFNLGALIGIPYSYVNPQGTIINNVVTTLNVLLVAREGRIGRVVQTSTSEVYGSARTVPIPETHVLQPQSPYSASKIATDALAASFRDSFDVPVAVIRPFNTYGPRQSARAVIPSTIAQAVAGTDIRVGATDTTRDFTFIEDTVRGFLLCGERPEAVGETINIGTGREITIADMIAEVVRIVGRGNRIVRDAARIRPPRSEVTRLCADIGKARQLLGYEPQVALEDGLRRTADWIAEHHRLFRPEAYAV